MAAKKREVSWFKTVGDLNEIYQDVNMKFSFVTEIDKKLTQCHEWIKCRDFLHDAVRTTVTGNSSSIYGFKFSTDKNPLVDMEKIDLLVAYKNAKFWSATRAQLSKGLKLINQIEKNVGEELSTINKVVGNPSIGYKHVWRISGPKMWVTCPQFVSLYTFLIRLGAQKFKLGTTLEETFENLKLYSEKADSCNDMKYLKKIVKYIPTVVKKRNSFAFYGKDGVSDLYKRDLSINTFHNRGGIVSSCTGNSPFEDVKLVMKGITEEVDK